MVTGQVNASQLGMSGNILLRQLGRADHAMLAPHLRELPVERGTTLLRPVDPLDALYFPDSTVLSLEETVSGGRPLEVGVVGREGLLGWPLLLGSARSAHTAVVQMRSGSLLRVAAEPLRLACDRSATLRAALLSFVDTIIVQMARAIASHLQDPLDRRLARYLLMRHDRIGGDVLPLHHDEIATGLHVRRASVTDRLHVLEGERLIRCNRGRVLIRERAQLETFAGEAYGIAEARYRALIAPFGKSPPPLAQAA